MKTRLPYRQFILIRKVLAVSMLSIIFINSGCSKQPRIDEHQDFINAIYRRIDTVQNKYIDNVFYFIDSSFNALSNPGIGDVFVKDSIKQIKYDFIKHDYKKAIALMDSMLVLTKEKIHEEKYAQRYVITLYEKGQCYINMKKYAEALRYISIAEEEELKLVEVKM